MKRRFVFYVLFSMAMIFQVHSYAHAGFLITMKNGRAILADNYQVKDDAIIIFLEEGTLKFSRQEVQSIKEDMSKKKTVDIEQRVMTQQEKKVEEPKSEAKDAKANDLATKHEEANLKKKAEITERLEEAKKVYFEAQGKAEKDSARERMVSISRKLFNWVEENEKGNAPSERK